MIDDTPGAPPPVAPRNGDEPRAAARGPAQPGARSGLRDPVRAVRGLGAGALLLETLVLLLAIQPIRILGGELTGAAIAVLVALAVAAIVLAGQMRRRWAWHGATVLQGLLLLAGFLHWSLAALGLIFGAVWVYVLHVRHTILG